MDLEERIRQALLKIDEFLDQFARGRQEEWEEGWEEKAAKENAFVKQAVIGFLDSDGWEAALQLAERLPERRFTRDAALSHLFQALVERGEYDQAAAVAHKLPPHGPIGHPVFAFINLAFATRNRKYLDLAKSRLDELDAGEKCRALVYLSLATNEWIYLAQAREVAKRETNVFRHFIAHGVLARCTKDASDLDALLRSAETVYSSIEVSSELREIIPLFLSRDLLAISGAKRAVHVAWRIRDRVLQTKVMREINNSRRDLN